MKNPDEINFADICMYYMEIKMIFMINSLISYVRYSPFMINVTISTNKNVGLV